MSKQPQMRYTRRETVDIIKEILFRNKIEYLTVTADIKTFTITQKGEHESAGALAALLIQAGIFGFDDDELTDEVTVTLVPDQFGVILRTVSVFDRQYAEILAAEAPEKEVAAKPVPKKKSTKTSKKASKPAPESEITRESVLTWTEDEVNDVLESHGITAEEYAGQTLEAKQQAIIKIVFID